MKKISILCPCFNEEENIVPIVDAILEECETNLKNYRYEVIIVDNCSTDNTKNLVEKICAKYPDKVKAIMNAKNFRANSLVHALKQTNGDCTIFICSDFQNPVELIHVFVEEWEKGHKIVCGVKTSSKENKLMFFIRTIFYKFMKKYSNVEQIEQFTGFGLYDKSFIDVLRQLDDSFPFFRGLVGEYGVNRKDIEFEQPKRKAGKSKMNFLGLYDTAMNGFTSYTKIGVRIATFLGIICGAISFIFLLVFLILGGLGLGNYLIQSMVSFMIFLTSIILFFIGFVGEYILAINQRMLHRPLVIEEKRINFENYDEDNIG